MTTDLHTKAVAIDTEIAVKFDTFVRARRVLMANTESIRTRLSSMYSVKYQTTDTLLEWARRIVDENTQVPLASKMAWLLGERPAIEANVNSLREEWLAADALYEGWSRFYLVVSSDGHIHSSLDCVTCHITTEYRWLPELSGLDEAAAVDAHGEILCSVCFPSAPVEWTNGSSRATKEARAAREEAKAERAAKKLEKALLPDGSALVLEHDTLTTLVSAKQWLTRAFEWNLNHRFYTAHEAQIVAAAVAAKTGETVEMVMEAAKKRAKKASR